MNKLLIAFVSIAAFGEVASADAPAHDQMTCGQHVAEKAALPASLGEHMTAVADMLEAHAAFMTAGKTKEGRKEAKAFKKVAKQHRKLAKEFKKTEAMMARMKDLPNAPHDMEKMMGDEKHTASMAAVLRTEEELAALLSKDIAEMKKMTSGGGM